MYVTQMSQTVIEEFFRSWRSVVRLGGKVGFGVPHIDSPCKWSKNRQIWCNIGVNLHFFMCGTI